MREDRKYRWTSALAVALCVLAIAYGLASEYIVPDIAGYMERRAYYENVISKKPLSLHPARFFKKLD